MLKCQFPFSTTIFPSPLRPTFSGIVVGLSSGAADHRLSGQGRFLFLLSRTIRFDIMYYRVFPGISVFIIVLYQDFLPFAYVSRFGVVVFFFCFDRMIFLLHCARTRIPPVLFFFSDPRQRPIRSRRDFYNFPRSRELCMTSAMLAYSFPDIRVLISSFLFFCWFPSLRFLTVPCIRSTDLSLFPPPQFKPTLPSFSTACNPRE